MKAFLMFPKKDFDQKKEPPLNHLDLILDLELNTLLEVMSQGDKFLYDVGKLAILSSITDIRTIEYRQNVLKDCIKNAAIVREIYQIPIESKENKSRRWMGFFTKNPSGVLSGSIEMMVMFVELLKKLTQIANDHADKFDSEGFQRFFSMIKSELDDEYFSIVDEHLKELKFRDGVLLSASLEKGNEGTNYMLRKSDGKPFQWLQGIFNRKDPVYKFRIHERDDAGFRAITDIKDQGINLVANALAQSADHIDSFFGMLRVELAFYVGCLNLYDKLTEMDCPISFPKPEPSKERWHNFKDLYDVSLALTMKKKIVGNEINADEKSLAIITGANQGGKSTFLRAIGLAQIMMQSGMFVAAEFFHANLSEGIFTHYRRKEDASMNSGKLDEELSRMSDIVDIIRPNALILFNESFSATNEREGSEIARQIVTALLDKSIKVFFVTHQYEFAHDFYMKKLNEAIFLRAERKEGGKRTFKLIEGEPKQTSFGKDLYYKVFGKEEKN